MRTSIRISRLLALAALVISTSPFANAKSIQTNAVSVPDAPAWLTALAVERAVDQVQNFLEWDIRRVQVKWYRDQSAFEKAHGFGSAVLAFAMRNENAVHVGPKVTAENFKTVFAHELTHIILYQKYKDSIPKWLEEGLANYASKHGRVDYAWLAAQPKRDVLTLNHPFDAFAKESKSIDRARYHYMASTALMEMISAKCSINDLLQLSVGKKLETYLKTFCGISNVNSDFAKWIERKRPKAAQPVVTSSPSPSPLPRKKS